jgi:hypothetical protein
MRWLWEQQSSDGGWHSKTYGMLRGGQSLTPFVLDALLGHPHDAAALEKGFEFLEAHPATDAVDYPNYSAGLAARIAGRLKRDASIWVNYLREQQFTEQNGWTRNDPAYGAWGMGGEVRRAPEPGHVDLAMTRYVLEGLAAAGVAAADPAMEAARVYLGRCQNPDGGFFFSTVNLDTNKAGEAEGHNRSYGTTTCDGIIALRAAGVSDSDPRIVRAKAWLKRHHLEERAPGFDIEPARMGWSEGLRLYYAAAVTRAMPELAVTLPAQRENGSFVNTSSLVKEDDPLIATAFALRALCHDKDG